MSSSVQQGGRHRNGSEEMTSPHRQRHHRSNGQVSDGASTCRSSPRRSKVKVSKTSPSHRDDRGRKPMAINTYYQELIHHKLQQQLQEQEERWRAADSERLENACSGRRSLARYGSKGAPWRQLKQTTGAKGENIMFVEDNVSSRDPTDCNEGGTVRSPRPLPSFYVGNVLTLDPNKTVSLLHESKQSPDSRLRD